METNENKLLSIKLAETRDFNRTKKNVDNLLYKYEEFKYKCHEICPPRITQSFEVRYEQFTLGVSDKVGSYVQRKLDFLKEADSFYNELKSAMNTLCNDELCYFKFYLDGISEENMCERLSTNRTSLRRIKQSCIIKIAMYFDIDVLATQE